jgi:hypothetical protein
MLLYYNADPFGLAVTVKKTVWAVSYRKSYCGLSCKKAESRLVRNCCEYLKNLNLK